MSDHSVFEIVLRIKGCFDYCTFEVDADTDLTELETLIDDLLCSHFVEVPEE